MLSFMQIYTYFASKKKSPKKFLMLIPKPLKDDDLRNIIGGSAQSTIQKVQRFHELEFLYASFMLYVCYRLCGL